jgi:predicted amidohydrolase
MSILNVAMLQLTATPYDQEKNLEKGIKFCRQAAQKKAQPSANVDVILFPEMWNYGYQKFDPKKPGDHEKWLNQAISIDDNFVKTFQDLAKELDTAIVITFLQKYEQKPKNTAALIDRHGNIVINYDKVHTCDFDVLEASCTAGKNFYVHDLDTKNGFVKIGLMICFDREFPESARILMLKGAEIILTPNACKLDEKRINQFQSRAFENMTGVAMANYAKPQHNGQSIAYDASGEKIIRAGEEEGIFVAQFDLEKLRTYRKKEPWGNAYRKPDCYKDLVLIPSASMRR